MSRSRNYSISELAEAAGTTPRTVRFYTAEGLLPPPDARGRFARYSDEHLDRLRLIARLKEAFQPLNAIRARLEHLTHRDIRELLDDSGTVSHVQTFDELLLRSAEVIRERSLQPAGSRPETDIIGLSEDFRGVSAEMAGRGSGFQEEADTWQRIMMAPGVELHIQVPYRADIEGRVEELIRTAKRLFEVPA